MRMISELTVQQKRKLIERVAQRCFLADAAALTMTLSQSGLDEEASAQLQILSLEFEYANKIYRLI